VLAEVCFANRLMFLLGSWPVKGESVRVPYPPSAAPHGTVAARWPAATLDRPSAQALRCFKWVTQREVMYAGVGSVRLGSWSLAAVR
jgi:hypothetical protein